MFVNQVVYGVTLKLVILVHNVSRLHDARPDNRAISLTPVCLRLSCGIVGILIPPFPSVRLVTVSRLHKPAFGRPEETCIICHQFHYYRNSNVR